MLRSHRFEPREVHTLDATTTYAFHDDTESAVAHRLAGLRHAAKQCVHEPTDRRHVLDAEVGVEQVAELIHRDTARDPEAPAVLLNLRFLDVVLIANLADDLLEN